MSSLTDPNPLSATPSPEPTAKPRSWQRALLASGVVLALGVISARCGTEEPSGADSDATAPTGNRPAQDTPKAADPAEDADAEMALGEALAAAEQQPDTGRTVRKAPAEVEFVRSSPLPRIQPGDAPAKVPAGIKAVSIVASGSMLSALEPCGCAKNQIGGLSRRMFHLSSLPKVDLLLEGGNTVREGHELDFQKWYTAMSVLYVGSHPYHAQGVGPKDLLLPQDDFRGIAGSFVPLTVADLVAAAGDDSPVPWPAAPFKEVTTEEGTTVRFTSLAQAMPKGTKGLTLLEPTEAWARAMTEAAEGTLRILMVHGSQEDAFAATGLSPRPDLVIGLVDILSEAQAKARTGVDGVPVVFPGNRGRWILELGLARVDGTPHLDLRATPLEGSASNPKAMRDAATDAQLLAHRTDVANNDVLQKMARQTPTHNGAAYVGSQRCSQCHVEEHAIWQTTDHAKAWQTLVDAEKDPERYGWPVTQYPECVACHTVGYGEQSGFVDPEATPEFLNVGCESCHGPGGKHVLDPVNEKPVLGDSTTCTKCHDHEQSPDFDYLPRWKKIAHGPKAKK